MSILGKELLSLSPSINFLVLKADQGSPHFLVFLLVSVLDASLDQHDAVDFWVVCSSLVEFHEHSVVLDTTLNGLAINREPALFNFHVQEDVARGKLTS